MPNHGALYVWLSYLWLNYNVVINLAARNTTIYYLIVSMGQESGIDLAKSFA